MRSMIIYAIICHTILPLKIISFYHMRIQIFMVIYARIYHADTDTI